MNKLLILIIRAILGVAISVIISRFFFESSNAIFVASLAVFLVVMAYLLEYMRK